jgi:hypothetical protein
LYKLFSVVIFGREAVISTRRKAKETGKLLAYSLALNYPFKFNTISFVGFSMGAQVIKKCVKTLYELGRNDLVHNVTLLAGPINLRETPGY